MLHIDTSSLIIHEFCQRWEGIVVMSWNLVYMFKMVLRLQLGMYGGVRIIGMFGDIDFG